MGSTPSNLAPSPRSIAFSDYSSFEGPQHSRDKEAPRLPNLEDGTGAEDLSVDYLTLGDLFAKAVKTKGDKPALRTERPCPPMDGKNAGPSLPIEEWKTWTYKQYYDECRMAAKAFMKMGLDRYDATSIFGFNSPEWLMGEVSTILAGGIAAGIYPTDTPAQVGFKAKHSGSSLAIVENIAKARVFLDQKENLPALKGVVVWDPDLPAGAMDELKSSFPDVQIVHWSELGAMAADVPEEELDARIADQRPGHVCCYIYTSGTTGNPKAVMITHDNIIFESTVVIQKGIHIYGNEPEEERVISYLPLSHVAGMMVDICCPLVVTANMPGWSVTHFARNYDLKALSIVERFKVVRPTLFLGVPRVWEKLQGTMTRKKQESIDSGELGGAKLWISNQFKEAGRIAAENSQMGGSGSKPMILGLAKKAYQKKVKKILGLDRCKFALTGAAPIQVDTLEFFGAIGLPINEVYGMSENCGAVTWSNAENHLWGSCGWSLPGCETKVLDTDGNEVPKADDINNPTEQQQGELCFRGRNIMLGYMANPDLGAEHVAEIQKKNEEAIDKNGFLHSGDKGCQDHRGLFKITGRYKELLIGAGGENVAPVPIEDNVKKLCPAVSNIMMVGDKMPFNCALVTLKTVGATGDLPGSNVLDAESKRDGVVTIADAVADKAYIAMLTKAISDTNADEAVCPMNASKIQKFSILPIDFSVITDELTPTFKLKRSYVHQKYTETIDAMYASKDTFVPCTMGYESSEPVEPAVEPSVENKEAESVEPAATPDAKSAATPDEPKEPADATPAATPDATEDTSEPAEN